MIARERRAPWELTPWRAYGFIAGCILIVLALIGRLIFVQLVNGEQYREAARANQVRLIPVAAPRGTIYDRNKHVLVRSRPSFVVAMIPSLVKDPNAIVQQVSQVTGIAPPELWQRLMHHRGVNYTSFDQLATYEPYGPVILVSDLSVARVARIAELLNDLPGIDLEAQAVRDYPHGGSGAQLYGYVGQITEDEYNRLKTQGYLLNDVIGKDGLESVYDSYLRGVPGGEQVVVDATGEVVPRAKRAFKPSVPGDSLVTSIDGRLQQIVHDALKAHLDALSRALHRRISGGVIALDPYSGGVMALQSYPDFDPNAFAVPGDKRVAHYLLDPANPLFDNAIAAETPTGSTFKMVTGTAAITEGKVRPDEIVYDSGGWNCSGYYARDIASGGLGRTTFVPALAASSDGYFYQMAWRLGHPLLRKWALLFGLDAKSGIDLPGEATGNWPTNEWMMKNFGVPLEPSDVCFLGIGQGAMQATPLQMANVASAVINGGTLYKPHVVQRIVNADGKTVRTFDREIIREIPASVRALQSVREGMARVTQPGGTAYGEGIDGLPFSGKTGTVETAGGSGPNTTWFVCWAPTDHPKFAMAVYVDRSGGYGASIAAPVAHDVLAKYFNKKP